VSIRTTSHNNIIVVVDASSTSPINVNIKSKRLSNVLGRGGDGDDHDDDDDDGGGNNGGANDGTTKQGLKRRSLSSSDTEHETNQSSSRSSSTTTTGGGGGVSLDLSGRFDCCVLGGNDCSSSGDATRTTADEEERVVVKSLSNHLDNRMVLPLFQRRRSRRSPTRHHRESALTTPNVFLGANYDFRKIWWGVTRVITTLAWETPSKGVGEQQLPPPGGRSRRGSGRMGATLSLEKGILTPNDYSTELKLIRRQSLPNNNNNEDHKPPPSISIRLDTDTQWNTSYSDSSTGGRKSVTLAGRTSIHPRIDIVAKSTTQFDHDHHQHHNGGEDDSTTHDFFSNRIPPRVLKGGEWKEGIWIPLISMTPGGKISSKNAFRFRDILSNSSRRSVTDDGISSSSSSVGGGDSDSDSERSSLSSSSSRWYDGMQTGIRLVVSRQLNWNALGLSNNEHSSSFMGENLTFLRLELSGLDRSGHTLRCITIEGAMERLRESARVTLLQERVVTTNNKKK